MSRYGRCEVKRKTGGAQTMSLQGRSVTAAEAKHSLSRHLASSGATGVRRSQVLLHQHLWSKPYPFSC